MNLGKYKISEVIRLKRNLCFTCDVVFVITDEFNLVGVEMIVIPGFHVYVVKLLSIVQL